MSSTSRLGVSSSSASCSSGLQQLRQAQEEQRRSGNNLGFALAKPRWLLRRRDHQLPLGAVPRPAVNLDEYEIDGEITKLVLQGGLREAPHHPALPLGVGAGRVHGETRRTSTPSTTSSSSPASTSSRSSLSRTAIAQAIDRAYKPGDDPELRRGAPGVRRARTWSSRSDAEDVNVLELEEGGPRARRWWPRLRQRHPPQRHQEGRQRHPRRALREEAPGALPRRYGVLLLEEMQPPVKLKNPLSSRLKDRRPPSTSPSGASPRTGASSSRWASGKEDGLPRLRPADHLGGEDRPPLLLDKGNLQLDMTKLGFEQGGVAGETSSSGHQPALGHGAESPGPPGRARPRRSTRGAQRPLNKIAHNISYRRGSTWSTTSTASTRCRCTTRSGWNFAAALRSFLRQDPDVVMVGEIRDFETAEIAVKARRSPATWLLSTLHTNDAPSTISRLLNMGVGAVPHHRQREPGSWPSAWPGKVCADCKAPIKVEPAADPRRLRLHPGPDRQGPSSSRARGLQDLRNGSGYKGRVALYEVMRFNDALEGDGALRAPPPPSSRRRR